MQDKEPLQRIDKRCKSERCSTKFFAPCFCGLKSYLWTRYTLDPITVTAPVYVGAVVHSLRNRNSSVYANKEKDNSQVARKFSLVHNKHERRNRFLWLHPLSASRVLENPKHRLLNSTALDSDGSWKEIK